MLPNVHDVIGRRSSKPSLFPPASELSVSLAYDVGVNGYAVDFTEFHINAIPSFLTFGHMIELIYTKSTQVTSYLTTKLSLNNICDINNVNMDSDNATAAKAAVPTDTMNQSKSKTHNLDESFATIPASPAAAAPVQNSEPIVMSTSPIETIFQEIVPQYLR